MLTTLRQPRYLGLLGICLVVAIGCLLAGTWQVARFSEKRAANHELRTNNSDRATDIAAVLGPATNPIGTGKALPFRHITATGSYLPQHETLVRGRTVNGDVGYLVITPLNTGTGVLLVARGFVPQTGTAKSTPTVAAPPTGTVTVTARLEAADSKRDRLGQLPNNQVESINPTEQAARLARGVWNGYAELLAGQPGTAGLTVIPTPDLSNPAGGADEPQHAAYVVQWYLFALLALAAPFVLAAAERRETEPQADKKPSLDDRLAGRA